MSMPPDSSGERPLDANLDGRPWVVVVGDGLLTGLSCLVVGFAVTAVALVGAVLALLSATLSLWWLGRIL